MHALSCALMDIDEMPKQRAAQIARSLNNKAMSLINRERQASLGITHNMDVFRRALHKDPVTLTPQTFSRMLPTAQPMESDSNSARGYL